ncbi:MAG: hypothetical protein QOG49_1852, partial [Frankiaceae bacterium]|nr:hypothetical protein [Frankiaceae bacterium]
TTEFAHQPRKRTAAAPRPPLRLVGRTDKGSAAAGEIVGYSIDVTNAGPRADGVTITDAIPANTEYVAGSATCLAPCRAAYDSATNTLIWRIPSLAAGRSSALSFRVRVLALTPRPDGSLPGTVLLNSAVGSASQTTATTSNEVRTVVLAVLGTKTVEQGRHIARGAPQRPALPVTGSRTGELLPVALLLIAAGSALLLGERRYTARGLHR